MADVFDPASMIEAAEKAAADGDYLAAEGLLRAAAAQQEADLGSAHPDLATTLNNLAFVCERLNKYDEAERGYRRAHKIAVASLSPGHPLIKTSLTNLLDFCAARGIPVWTPPAAQADEESEPADAITEPPKAEAVPKLEHEPVAVATTRRFPLPVMAVAVLGVVAVVALVATRQGQGTPAPSVLSPGPGPGPSPEPSPGPSPGPSPEPSPEPGPGPSPGPGSQPVLTPETAAVVKREERSDATEADVDVLAAQLCRALERRGSPDWQCTPADGELTPGTYLFYTRLLTNEATAVEHRWYVNGRMHQRMKLRITPAPGGGYRTFSSNTVSPERTGDWKVELRAADGSVLHEKQFVVR
jgi:hypothetical protein